MININIENFDYMVRMLNFELHTPEYLFPKGYYKYAKTINNIFINYKLYKRDICEPNITINNLIYVHLIDCPNYDFPLFPLSDTIYN